MSNIAIIIFLIFFFFLAIFRLRLAVMFILAALPAYLIRFKVFGLPLTLLEAMVLVSFFVWFSNNYKLLFSNIKKNLEIRSWKLEIKDRYPFDWEIVFLIIIAFIAAGTAGFANSALGIWKAYFFEPVLFFILFLNTIGKEKKFVDFTLWPLAISSLVISLLAIYQKFSGAFIFNELWAAEGSRRVTSFFGYPNAVGLYLGPLIVLLSGWLYQKIKNYKLQITNKSQIPNLKFQILEVVIISLVIILSILSVYFAKSKGALVGLGVAFLVFGILANKKIRWVISTSLLVLAIGVSVYAPARTTVYNKIIYSKSLQIRIVGWQETWERLKDGRLITGVGLANYQDAVAPYYLGGFFYNDGSDPEFHRHTVWNAEYRAKAWQPLEIYLYPHNIFLNFWSELGLSGLLLFIWVIARFFAAGFRLTKKYNANPQINANTANYKYANKYLVIGLIGAMVVIVVHGLVDVPYFKNDLALMFWLLAALMGLFNLKLKAGNK